MPELTAGNAGTHVLMNPFYRSENVKFHIAIQPTHPDFSSPCFQVEFDLFLNFARRIVGRENFDTDFRCSRQTGGVLRFVGASSREPCHIDCFDTVRGRKRTLRKAIAMVDSERSSSWRNLTLTIPMIWSGRWTHDDVAMAVRFDSVRKLS